MVVWTPIFLPTPVKCFPVSAAIRSRALVAVSVVTVYKRNATDLRDLHPFLAKTDEKMCWVPFKLSESEYCTEEGHTDTKEKPR